MTINNDLFVRPPLSFEIPNDGVTTVGPPDSDKQWKVLEYELTSFVSEGAYEDGLERILGSYLRNRGNTRQPAVWVSGFYGSGKSHLVRVLQHLWADTCFPDGASSRGLVSVPAGIAEQLTELTMLGRRDGAAPWSAAGALDRSGESLNAVFLSIVLGAAGLPVHVAPAQVALWLAGRGELDAVRAHVEAKGGTFTEELDEYNLSTLLADAIVAVNPGFAQNGADVRKALSGQFPPRGKTPSTGETLTLLRKVLNHIGDGSIPPTLIVLDEVQQYISGDGGRAMEVQHLVEALSSQMDGRVLLVATGQQELTADATLQRIQDRFTVKVVLKDQDVDAVVRRVLLKKEPAKRPELATTLDEVAGSISRQLPGTKIQQTAQDDEVLVDDYPLLPSRRKFWESVLRQVDFGRAGQLRSQLRIVHDANRRAAEKPVGTVVGADYLYDAKNDDLNGAAMLPKDTQRLIAEERQKDPLRGRVLGLIHLIGLLPTSDYADIGVRATAAHIADLLAEDLARDGDRLRRNVPLLLEALATEGVLQQDGDEFRIQTEAGRTWTEAFRRHAAQVTPSELVGERDTLLEAELRKSIPQAIQQGRAKVNRKLVLHANTTAPTADNDIPVWLRSEWNDEGTAKQFDETARGLGSDSAVVLVHLPRLNAGAFEQSLRARLAAQRTLDQQGIPLDELGKQARRAMDTRHRRAQEQVDAHVREVLARATVLLGGGAVPSGTALRDRIETAAQDAATRLFNRYSVADDARWGAVIDRIKRGSAADALKVTGYDGSPEQHPVVKEILDRIGGAGTPAADVEKVVVAAPYGWPKDAFMAAVGILIDGGLIRATINGSPATAKEVLAQTRLGPVHLRREVTVLSASDKIAARSLLSSLGVPSDNDRLPSAAEEAVRNVIALAASISGPAPLPDITIPGDIQVVLTSSGNDRVKQLLAVKEALTDAHHNLVVQKNRLDERQTALTNARLLARAAAGLPSAAEARSRLTAFEGTRELLSPTDHVASIVTDLTAALREQVAHSFDELATARERAVMALQKQDAWTTLDEDTAARLLRDADLSPEDRPDLSDSTAVLKAVQHRPLASWDALRDAVSARAAKALDAAVKLTAPKAVTVHVPTASLTTAEEVEAYLARLRDDLMQGLEGAGTIVVTG